MSLVGRNRPVANEPNTCTVAAGNMAVMTSDTRDMASWREARSSGVGSRNRQNSAISLCRRKSGLRILVDARSHGSCPSPDPSTTTTTPGCAAGPSMSPAPCGSASLPSARPAAAGSGSGSKAMKSAKGSRPSGPSCAPPAVAAAAGCCRESESDSSESDLSDEPAPLAPPLVPECMLSEPLEPAPSVLSAAALPAATGGVTTLSDDLSSSGAARYELAAGYAAPRGAGLSNPRPSPKAAHRTYLNLTSPPADMGLVCCFQEAFFDGLQG
mmetsp:Transcript_200/g.580  ORF Transcript_200/g.580 Transcript_200/m.580 type:complete len:270 (+) Transcript_200:769-1578(+)